MLQRPLLKAILSEKPTVLLIDEIDRADAEFEAFLLEVLSDFQVSVPELGTLEAIHRPLVVLTSNNTRELSEALKRRCLYLFIDYPTLEQELAVVRLKVPELDPKLARQAVELVQKLRGMDLRKSPSISETLDWAKALVTFNSSNLDEATLETTLTVLLKHESDLQRAKRQLFTPRLRATAIRAARGSKSVAAALAKLASTYGPENRPIYRRVARQRGAGQPGRKRGCLPGHRTLGIQDRETFRISLRTTLVKEQRDISMFEKLFPLFFQPDQPPPMQGCHPGALPERSAACSPRPCAASTRSCAR